MDDLMVHPTDRKLLDQLRTRPHPNADVTAPSDLGAQEALQQARIAHHLCDLAGVPRKIGGLSSPPIDARLLLLSRLAQRVTRLADLHQPDRSCDGHGGNSGYCVECGWAWPCATADVVSGRRDDEV